MSFVSGRWWPLLFLKSAVMKLGLVDQTHVQHHFGQVPSSLKTFLCEKKEQKEAKLPSLQLLKLLKL